MNETKDTRVHVPPTPKDIVLTHDPTVYEVKPGTLTARHYGRREQASEEKLLRRNGGIPRWYMVE